MYMAKMEEFEEDEKPPHIKTETETLPHDGVSPLSLPSSLPVCETEGSLPSSSSGSVKSYFVGMGFSPTLVDKVMKERGQENADALLETLLTRSALDRSPDMERDDSPFELFTSDSEIEESGEPVNLDSDKRSSLLAMNFSVEEVELAIKHLGENAPLPELIDLIIASQTSESNIEKDLNGSVGILERFKETAMKAMFGTMDATLRLLDMGFTEQEISSAIDNFGSEVPVGELAGAILANRVTDNCVKEEEGWSEDSSSHSWHVQHEQRCLNHSTEECQNGSSTRKGNTATSSSIDACGETQTDVMAKHVSVYERTEGCSKRSFSATEMGEDVKPCLDDDGWDYKEMQKGKKGKYILEYDKAAFYDNTREARIPKSEDEHSEMPTSFKGPGHFSRGFPRFNEHEHCNESPSVRHFMSKPPFFFYGNVVDVSQGTWRKLSHFLYGIEPEHVNTQFFSAFIRNEGYFHNLPKENRFHIVPRPPMTIEDSLPHTKKWWPSWDTRKQFSCVSLDTIGVAHICKRLEKMLIDSHGILSKEQQMDTLHQCRTLNLVWVGDHRLSPIEPGQIERILGYPMQHTQVEGLELTDRLRGLKCCFQTDTLGYHISVLKKLFPSGLRVLSIFSGIGGAEIALHRLGIHLKCVISIEASEVNRRILKRWWQKTGQSGELQQIEGIERLTSKKIETLIEQFGGFDIVIGGSPCTCLPRGPSSGKSVGLDLNLFYEFVRVFQRVRSIMGRNS